MMLYVHTLHKIVTRGHAHSQC